MASEPHDFGLSGGEALTGVLQLLSQSLLGFLATSEVLEVELLCVSYLSSL